MTDFYILLILTAVLGLCFGSFANVLIYRIPENISIINPRSFCPKCKISIPFYRNIPIFSFILQLGKCHNCSNKISLQYPLIELFMGSIWLYFMFDFKNQDLFNTISSICIISTLIPLAIIDLKHLYFPLSLLVILILLGIIQACMSYDSFIGLMTGLSFLSLIFFLVKIWFKINKRNDTPMGFGDILLIIPLGAWLGPLGILLCFFLSSVLALFFWIMLFIMKGFSFKQKMPFGPYLIGSSILIKITDLDQLIFVLISQIK